jgi:uncharacterized membrane protein YccF (DUF307 family)
MFFVEQFKIVIDFLWDIIDLKLIPYGNTTQIDANNFVCPFGRKQCFANRAQVIKKIIWIIIEYKK